MQIAQLWTQRLPTPLGKDLAFAEVWVKGHASAPHAHPGFSVLWTQTGWDYFSCGDYAGPVPADSLVLIAEEQVHCDRAGAHGLAHSLALYFPPGYASLAGMQPTTPVQKSERLAALLRTAAVEARQGDETCAASLQALVAALAERLSVAKTTPAAEVKPPRGGSRSAHLRAYVKSRGCTPGQDERQKRVRHVASLLLAGARPAEAAAEAGFCDQSHMNRLFLLQFGVTPARFAKCNSVQDDRLLEV